MDQLLDIEGSPLTAPRIHPEAAHALYFDAKKLGANKDFQIEVTVPSAELHRGAEVETAVRTHFLTEESDAGSELLTALRRGWLSLLFALMVVAAMVVLSEWLQTLGTGRIYSLLGESLVIIGWVTLWMPAETLLFEQFAIRHRRALARSLGRAEVKLLPRERAGSAAVSSKTNMTPRVPDQS